MKKNIFLLIVLDMLTGCEEAQTWVSEKLSKGTVKGVNICFEKTNPNLLKKILLGTIAYKNIKHLNIFTSQTGGHHFMLVTSMPPFALRDVMKMIL